MPRSRRQNGSQVILCVDFGTSTTSVAILTLDRNKPVPTVFTLAAHDHNGQGEHIKMLRGYPGYQGGATAHDAAKTPSELLLLGSSGRHSHYSHHFWGLEAQAQMGTPDSVYVDNMKQQLSPRRFAELDADQKQTLQMNITTFLGLVFQHAKNYFGDRTRPELLVDFTQLDTIVGTVPSCFEEDAIEFLKKCLEMAKTDSDLCAHSECDIEICPEPEAVAERFLVVEELLEKVDTGDFMVVVDAGGSTTDGVCMRLISKDEECVLFAIDDEDLVQDGRPVGSQTLNENVAVAIQRRFEEAGIDTVNAKRSARTYAKRSFDIMKDRLLDDIFEPILREHGVTVRIDRRSMNSIVKRVFQEIWELCESLLNCTVENPAYNEGDNIMMLLTGGFFLNRYLREFIFERIEREFPKVTVRFEGGFPNPVVYGAALRYANKRRVLTQPRTSRGARLTRSSFRNSFGILRKFPRTDGYQGLLSEVWDDTSRWTLEDGEDVPILKNVIWYFANKGDAYQQHFSIHSIHEIKDIYEDIEIEEKLYASHHRLASGYRETDERNHRYAIHFCTLKFKIQDFIDAGVLQKYENGRAIGKRRSMEEYHNGPRPRNKRKRSEVKSYWLASFDVEIQFGDMPMRVTARTSSGVVLAGRIVHAVAARKFLKQ